MPERLEAVLFGELAVATLSSTWTSIAHKQGVRTIMVSQSTHNEAADDELYGTTLISPCRAFSSASTP